MKQKLTQQEINHFRELEQHINDIVEATGDITPEAEDIMMCIAQFCVNNNISAEEYEMAISINI